MNKINFLSASWHFFIKKKRREWKGERRNKGRGGKEKKEKIEHIAHIKGKYCS